MTLSPNTSLKSIFRRSDAGDNFYFETRNRKIALFLLLFSQRLHENKRNTRAVSESEKLHFKEAHTYLNPREQV